MNASTWSHEKSTFGSRFVGSRPIITADSGPEAADTKKLPEEGPTGDDLCPHAEAESTGGRNRYGFDQNRIWTEIACLVCDHRMDADWLARTNPPRM
ncbi:hypothetical protein ACFYT3_32370 [Nocardia amikacinitolerans]|uniref:hypothetical protein n=1 Tax=Nocardia amikacinitolerans TaxID=756689 RepID=UPI0036D0DCCA